MDAYDGWWCEPREIDLGEVLASAGLAYELPGVALFSIASFAFELVTDGNAANRQVVAGLKGSKGKVLFAEAAPAVQTASLTVQYSFAPEVIAFGTLALGFMGGAFVGRKLPQNLSVFVTVAAHQVGDKIVNAGLLVHQWPIEPPDYNVQVPA